MRSRERYTTLSSKALSMQLEEVRRSLITTQVHHVRIEAFGEWTCSVDLNPIDNGLRLVTTSVVGMLCQCSEIESLP